MNVVRYTSRITATRWSANVTVSAWYERERYDSDPDDVVKPNGKVETDFGFTSVAELDDRSMGGDVPEWRVRVSQSGVGALDVEQAIVRIRVMLLAAREGRKLRQRVENGLTPENLAKLNGKRHAYTRSELRDLGGMLA